MAVVEDFYDIIKLVHVTKCQQHLGQKQTYKIVSKALSDLGNVSRMPGHILGWGPLEKLANFYGSFSNIVLDATPSISYFSKIVRGFIPQLPTPSPPAPACMCLRALRGGGGESFEN